jgi:hypothetical protein
LSSLFYQLVHSTETEQRSHASAALHAKLTQPLWIPRFAPAPDPPPRPCPQSWRRARALASRELLLLRPAPTPSVPLLDVNLYHAS